MAINSSLNLTDLDFDRLKASLITFLRSQEQFKDYDFAGANINVLLDLLAHNTQKKLFFLNMNFAESWLDSAQLRNSIASAVKPLNYTPRSVRSAVARVKVTFNATAENQPYIVQKGSAFSSLIRNTSYVFTIPETITVTSTDTAFEFETDIYEGVYLKDTYVVKPNTLLARYKLMNNNVDTRSINVVVFEDGSLVGQTYQLATSLLDLTSTSKVFFLQATENGYYEIQFGDDNIGKAPKAGSLVVIDYRVSQGDKANGAAVFTVAFDPTSPNSELTSRVVVETISSAQEGADRESIESIKYYAPRHFQVQERCVIPSDYEISLKEQYPEINACSVIGGEDMDPPQFGKVFIAVDLKDVDGLPETKIEEYEKFIRRRSAMKPVFIQPEFTFFHINTTIKYNINITTNTPNNIKTLVLAGIQTYNTDFLNDFGLSFYKSDFTSMLDEIDPSIVSNMTEVDLYKKINPVLNDYNDFTLKFGVPLKNDLSPKADQFSFNETTTLFSSPFYYQGLLVNLVDDSTGRVWIVRKDTKKYNKLIDIGSIDYDKGTVILNDFIIENYNGAALQVHVRPREDDFTLLKQDLAYIEMDKVTINVEQWRA